MLALFCNSCGKSIAIEREWFSTIKFSDKRVYDKHLCEECTDTKLKKLFLSDKEKQ